MTVLREREQGKRRKRKIVGAEGSVISFPDFFSTRARQVNRVVSQGRTVSTRRCSIPRMLAYRRCSRKASVAAPQLRCRWLLLAASCWLFSPPLERRIRRQSAHKAYYAGLALFRARRGRARARSAMARVKLMALDEHPSCLHPRFGCESPSRGCLTLLSFSLQPPPPPSSAAFSLQLRYSLRV